MGSQFPLPSQPMQMAITPAIARDWLTYRSFDGNRKTDDEWAMSLAVIMDAGGWFEDSHQGLAFDEQGKILDGQHRLRAIELSGKSIKFWVFPDVPRATFAGMDSGKVRRAYQFMDVSNPTTVASAVRYVVPVLRNAPTSEFYERSISMQRTLQVQAEWPELSYWVTSAMTVARNVGIQAAPLTAIVAMGQRARGDVFHIQEFLNGLVSGANMDVNDPRLQLRNRFIQARSAAPGTNPAAPVRGSREARARGWSYMVKQFKLWMNDETVGRLIWDKNKEGVPEVWKAEEVRRWSTGQ